MEQEVFETNQSVKCIACPFNTFPEVNFMGCGNNICIVDDDYKLKNIEILAVDLDETL